MSRLRLFPVLGVALVSAVPLLLAGCPITEDNAVDGNVEDGPPAESLVEASLTNQRPSASAGDDVSVVAGELVTLNGAASLDADGDRLSYVWRQVSGEPQTELKSPFASITTFVAPAVTAETTLVFRLTVVDGFAAANDEITITVLP